MRSLITAGLLGFLLCLFASGAYAADAELGQYGDMSGRQVLDTVISMQPDFQNEYMHRWFRQIFGGFVFSDGSNEVGLIAYVLGFTNILALFLGVIIVFYVFIAGAVNTAQSGEVLGKSWSTVWLPVRTFAGFALIMPVPGIGGGVFSAAQMAVVSLLIMGSNSATFLWNYTADKMVAGASIVTPVGLDAPITVPQDILASLICSAGYVRYHQDADPNGWFNQGVRTVASVYPYPKGSNSADLKSRTVSGGQALPDGAFARYKNSKVLKIDFAGEGQCGSIVFPWEDSLGGGILGVSQFDDAHAGIQADGARGDSGDSSIRKGVGRTDNGYKQRAAEAGTQAAQDMVLQLIDALVPVAQKTVDEIDRLDAGIASKKPEQMELLQNLSVEFTKKAYAYTGGFTPAVRNTMSAGDIGRGFKADMTKGGWAGAGRWYMELSTFTSMTYRIVNAFGGVTSKGKANLCSDSDCADFASKLYSASSKPSLYLSEGRRILNMGGNSSPLDQLASSCSSGQFCTDIPPTSIAYSSYLAAAVLNTVASSDANDSSPTEDTSGLVDPFQTISSIGHRMNAIAGGLMIAGRAIHYSKFGAEGFARAGGVFHFFADSATGGLANSLKWIVVGLLEDLLDFSKKIMIACFVFGFSLAYLIPFLPLLTWVTMVTGYLVTAIEAVVASPLAVILMVTPEGEGIAGTRLERAMQLIAMATLKPSLLIVGLVASFGIASVGFSVFNLLFWDSVALLLRDSVFNFFAIMIIYTIGAYQLTNTSVSIMYTLGNNILDWFSSGTGRSFGEDRTEGAMGGASSMIKEQAQGMAHSMARRSEADPDPEEKK